MTDILNHPKHYTARRPFSGEAKGRMVGNSVCPPHAAALVRANCGDMARARG